MSLATTLASGLNAGPSTGASLSGGIQVVISGTFKATTGQIALVVAEVSGDGGTTWVPVPGSAVSAPISYVLDLGTGAQIRINVQGGGVGVSITALAGALP